MVSWILLKHSVSEVMGGVKGRTVDPRVQTVPVASSEALLGEPFLVAGVLHGHGGD